MIKCPCCNKFKDDPKALAGHIIMLAGLEKEDLKHQNWLNRQEVNLLKPIKSLTELFERGEIHELG